jgi:hypothetical protein
MDALERRCAERRCAGAADARERFPDERRRLRIPSPALRAASPEERRKAEPPALPEERRKAEPPLSPRRGERQSPPPLPLGEGRGEGGARDGKRGALAQVPSATTRDEARHHSDAARRRAVPVICLNAPSLARSAVSLWVLLVANDFDDTVGTVYFVIGPGRPIQRVGLLRKNAVAKLHSPEAIDVYGLVVCVAQSAEKLALARPEGVDRAVAEIADQQCAAELSEARRRKRESHGALRTP